MDLQVARKYYSGWIWKTYPLANGIILVDYAQGNQKTHADSQVNATVASH